MGFLGDNSAPSAYQYGGMGRADQGALNATASLPRAAYSTGYDPSSTVQAGQNVMQSVQGLQPYWTQALQQGFDPQQDYYNRASNQNQQRALAMQAAQGVANTPYGAGLSNQAQNNFDIDWQRDALNRQAQGAQTATGLMGQYASGMTGGSNLGQSGAQFAMSIPQLQAQNYMNYLQGGTSATNAGVNSFNATQNSSNNFWGGLGQLGGAALGAFF